MRALRLGMAMSLLFVPSLGLSTTRAHPLRDVPPGEPAPAFELKDTQGKTHALASYGGKAVVLAYVRAGQPFSDKVLELLAALRRRYQASEVAVLAVSRPEEGSVQAPAKLPFPMLLDPDRALYGAWGFFVLPTTVALDRRHRVAAAVSTFPEGLEDDITRAVDQALGRPVAAPKVVKETAPAAPAEAAMARRLLASGKAAEAFGALEGALRSSPSPETLVLAAEALAALGRADEAAARCQAALKADPEHQRASLVLGRARTLQGRLQEAEQLLKASLVRTTDPGQAHYWLGQLYERQGRKDAALAEYRAALERTFGP
ncbi:MAG: redoxin domain-containing protein [Elusimicrobia bacterium]|nr:redoxin domain-containing protein [Elusimicrobiota bacterium]